MSSAEPTPQLASRPIGVDPARLLMTRGASWYDLNVVPMNKQIEEAALKSLGNTPGKIIGIAFRVVPIMFVILILPQPAALVGFTISFVIRAIEPSAFKDYPTLSKLCAHGMGFYSALKALQCSFFALDPLYLISMAIHLAVTLACFTFIKEMERRIAREERRKAEALPPGNRRMSIGSPRPPSTVSFDQGERETKALVASPSPRSSHLETPPSKRRGSFAPPPSTTLATLPESPPIGDSPGSDESPVAPAPLPIAVVQLHLITSPPGRSSRRNSRATIQHHE